MFFFRRVVHVDSYSSKNKTKKKQQTRVCVCVCLYPCCVRACLSNNVLGVFFSSIRVADDSRTADAMSDQRTARGSRKTSKHTNMSHASTGAGWCPPASAIHAPRSTFSMCASAARLQHHYHHSAFIGAGNNLILYVVRDNCDGRNGSSTVSQNFGSRKRRFTAVWVTATRALTRKRRRRR